MGPVLWSSDIAKICKKCAITRRRYTREKESHQDWTTVQHYREKVMVLKNAIKSAKIWVWEELLLDLKPLPGLVGAAL